MNYTNIHKTFLCTAFILMTLYPFAPSNAQECLPGLPCEFEPFTPSDDYLQLDQEIPGNNQNGPNRGEGPNIPKLDYSTNSVDSHACDADFMNQIYGRAFLESEREVVMSETIIRKPDSVLEYTCFDQHIELAAGPVAGIFTDSDAFADYTVAINGAIGEIVTAPLPEVEINVFMGEDYHDTTVENLVFSTLETYIGLTENEGNFWHTYLGGINPLDWVPGQAPCSAMYEIHYAAKCTNIDQNLSFLTFEQLAGLDFLTPDQLPGLEDDPRALPRECPADHQITDDLIALAENRDFEFVQYDIIDTFLDLTLRRFGCASPIPTGVTVIEEDAESPLFGPPTVDRSEWPDGVCPNPGCTLEEGGGSCF